MITYKHRHFWPRCIACRRSGIYELITGEKFFNATMEFYESVSLVFKQTLEAMIKKINLPLIVVLIILIEGLAIYLNMVAHPQSQPGLTIFIVLLLALIFGIVMTIITRKNKPGINMDFIKTTNDKFKYGIGFWAGGGVYSLINLLMNAKRIVQSKILFYNYLITAVAVLGLIFNLILWKKRKK